MELVAVAAVTAAGGLVAKDQGVVRRTILIDTEGDGQPGGTFVTLVDLDLRRAAPCPSTTCAQSRRS